MSVLYEYISFRLISGLMYLKVPMLGVTVIDSEVCDEPKSAIFTLAC
jgi:hypothetical protein